MSNTPRSSNARARQTRAQAEAELFKYDDSANLCKLETSPVSGAERWVQMNRVTRSACRSPASSSIHSHHSQSHSHTHSTPEPTHKLPTPPFEPEISDDQGPDLTDDQEDEGGTQCYAYALMRGERQVVVSETVQFDGDRVEIRKQAARHGLTQLENKYAQLVQKLEQGEGA